MGEPLCRLCSAAGKIVPAAVVDHILPIADGGTHEQSNLMPLCKRCHDAIKTPEDLRVRARAARANILLHAVSLGEKQPKYGGEWAAAKPIDFRLFRRQNAERIGFDLSHKLTLAAIDGVLRARMLGDLPPCSIVIVMDDAAWAKRSGELFNTEIKIETADMVLEAGISQIESEWLRGRYGNEYSARHEQETIGSQDETTTKT